MKIVVDLDGTVFQTYELAAKRYREETGRKFRLKNFAFNNKIDSWFEEYFLSKRSLDAPPYDKALEILELIQLDDAVYFITSRDRVLESETKKKMDYLGFQKVYFAPRKIRTKLLKILETDLLIDDDLELALKASENRIPTILMARPWNDRKYYGNKYLIKAYDWEFVAYLVKRVVWNKNL